MAGRWPITALRGDTLKRHISGKGLGLVAATDLAAGTSVLEEEVLLSVTAAPSEEWEVLSAAIKALSEGDRAAYFRLANSFAAQHSDAYGVYRTNGFRTSRGDSARARHGVFRRLSRVNHSCLANCAVSTHGGKLAVLRAATDIPAGRELTLCYLNGLATSARVLRQEGLERSFNFVICHLAPGAGDVTEWGRRLLHCSVLADGVGGPIAEALGRCVADPVSRLAAADRLAAALAAGDVNAADEARGHLWGEDGGLLREQLPAAADIEMMSTLPQPA